MNQFQQLYTEGFMKQCSVRGVDPEVLVKQALGPMDLVAGGQLAGQYQGANPALKQVPQGTLDAPNPVMGSGNAAIRATEDRMRSAVTRPGIPPPASGNPTPQHPQLGINPVRPAVNNGSGQTPTT